MSVRRKEAEGFVYKDTLEFWKSLELQANALADTDEKSRNWRPRRKSSSLQSTNGNSTKDCLKGKTIAVGPTASSKDKQGQLKYLTISDFERNLRLSQIRKNASSTKTVSKKESRRIDISVVLGEDVPVSKSNSVAGYKQLFETKVNKRSMPKHDMSDLDIPGATERGALAFYWKLYIEKRSVYKTHQKNYPMYRPDLWASSPNTDKLSVLRGYVDNRIVSIAKWKKLARDTRTKMKKVRWNIPWAEVKPMISEGTKQKDEEGTDAGLPIHRSQRESGAQKPKEVEGNEVETSPKGSNNKVNCEIGGKENASPKYDISKLKTGASEVGDGEKLCNLVKEITEVRQQSVMQVFTVQMQHERVSSSYLQKLKQRRSQELKMGDAENKLREEDTAMPIKRTGNEESEKQTVAEVEKERNVLTESVELSNIETLNLENQASADRYVLREEKKVHFSNSIGIRGQEDINHASESQQSNLIPDKDAEKEMVTDGTNEQDTQDSLGPAKETTIKEDEDKQDVLLESEDVLTTDTEDKKDAGLVLRNETQSKCDDIEEHEDCETEEESDDPFFDCITSGDEDSEEIHQEDTDMEGIMRELKMQDADTEGGKGKCKICAEKEESTTFQPAISASPEDNPPPQRQQNEAYDQDVDMFPLYASAAGLVALTVLVFFFIFLNMYVARHATDIVKATAESRAATRPTRSLPSLLWILVRKVFPYLDENCGCM